MALDVVKKSSDASFLSPCSNFIAVATDFSTAIASRTLKEFFATIPEDASRPGSISVVKKDGTDQIVASLAIDFFENTISTVFDGRELSLKLSNAMGFIRDFSDIFSKIRTSKGPEHLLAIQNECFDALTSTNPASKDIVLKVEEKELAAFYPSNGRVVLQQRSSIPLKMVQSCAHLFSNKFAKEICPLLGLEPSADALLKGTVQLYVGRCVVGLANSMRNRQYGEVALQREMARIVGVMAGSPFAFYTGPVS